MLIKVENTGQFGIVQDAAAQDLPNNAWSSGKNVRFRNGYAEKFSGQNAIYDPPSVKPYHLQPLTTATGRFWVYGSLTKLYAVSNLTHTNITRQTAGVDVDYAATADARWNGGVLSGIAILNNGVDDPQYWAGDVGTNAAALTAWPASTKCAVIRTFKSHLIAMNITKGASNYPYMVKWSHPADAGTLPASWDHTDPTKDAGEYDLSDDAGHVVDGLALGETFIVYKENAYYAMSYIGAPYIFRFNKISDYGGALATNCVAYFPGGHLVFGQGDIFVHQGGAPQSILTGVMRKWLYSNLDSQYYSRSFVVANPASNEVWVCFPETGQTSCTLALVWNWKDNTTTIRDLPSALCGGAGVIDYQVADSWNSDTETWDDDATPWNFNEYTQAAERLVIGSDSTKIYMTDASKTFAGTNFNAYMQREGMHFGAPEAVKLCKSIRPRFDAAPGTAINVYLGGSMDASAGTTWSGPYTFTVGSSYKVDGFASGRYLAVKFESTGAVSWRLKSYDIELEQIGAF